MPEITPATSAPERCWNELPPPTARCRRHATAAPATELQSGNSTLKAALCSGTSNQTPKRRHATLLTFEEKETPVASLSGQKKTIQKRSDPTL